MKDIAPMTAAQFNKIPITDRLRSVLFRMYLIDMDTPAHLEQEGNELIYQTNVFQLDRGQCDTLSDEFPAPTFDDIHERRDLYKFVFTPKGIQIRFDLKLIIKS